MIFTMGETMKYLKILMICMGLLLIISCNMFDDQPSDVDMELAFSNQLETYVWGDVIEISIDFDEDEDEEDIELVRFFINNQLMLIDMVEPYQYEWSTESFDYDEYQIVAKIQVNSRNEYTLVEKVDLMPCQIKEDDLANFNGVTETDEQGICLGYVDEDDWHHSFYNMFGPAYPNPTSNISIIPFSFTEETDVTLFIVDNDFNIESILLDKVSLSIGSYQFTWVAQEHPEGFYRAILHLSEDKHFHGDILVEGNK